MRKKLNYLTLLYPTMLYLFFCYLPENSSGQKDTLNIGLAEKIVHRAQEICVFVPDSSDKEFFRNSLSKIMIIQTEPNGIYQLPEGTDFVLVISEKTYHELNRQTLFAFNPTRYQETGKTVINMYKTVDQYSDNSDALACFLIHEFFHAKQASIRLGHNIILSPDSIYEEEMAAWQLQTYLYDQIHPGVLTISCDCTTMKLFPTEEQLKVISFKDIITADMTYFFHCGDTFLNRIYHQK